MKGTHRTALTVVVAALALILAAGTGATAARLLTGKQVKDGSLTSKDIKNRSLKVKDLSHLATAKLKGAAGPAGPAGPRGATGDTGPSGLQGLVGPQGEQGLQGLQGLIGPEGPQGIPGVPGLPGLSGFNVVTRSVAVPGLSGMLGGTGTVAAACDEGQKALSATATYGAPAANLASLLSQITRTADDAFSVSGLNLLSTEQTLTLKVVCATVAD